MSSLLGQLKSLASPSQLLPLWKLLKNVPGRGVIMGRLAGQLAAYTGTIRPEVVSLEKGVARVLMRDTRHVRNHLNSLHAAALMNLAEMTTGMAVISALPEGLRGIPTHVAMDYLKKARGPITAECTCAPVTSREPQNLEVIAELKNEAGDVVARALAKWRVGA
ncbi:MAG: DUF4442 domain-containing protein [Myxococcales bacterium]|nr:DUF4442 domain-containing protein [Myxococcales bacterium]